MTMLAPLETYPHTHLFSSAPTPQASSQAPNGLPPHYLQQHQFRIATEVATTRVQTIGPHDHVDRLGHKVRGRNLTPGTAGALAKRQNRAILNLSNTLISMTTQVCTYWCFRTADVQSMVSRTKSLLHETSG
jgi:hypothetical protein